MSLMMVEHELRSDAPNAYLLLDDIVTLVETDPHLVYLADWYTASSALDSLMTRSARVGQAPQRRVYPQCQTAGCIAGWVTMLTGTRAGANVARVAANLLGFEVVDIDGLFSGHVYAPDGRQLPKLVHYGTPEYEAAVIQRIREFQAAHEYRLRRTPTPVHKRAHVTTEAPAAAAPAPEPELVGV